LITLSSGVGAGTGSAAGGTAKTSPPPSPGGQAAKTKKMRKDSAASGAGELPGVTQWAETGLKGQTIPF
jgi:hypothetical protein